MSESVRNAEWVRVVEVGSGTVGTINSASHTYYESCSRLFISFLGLFNRVRLLLVLQRKIIQFRLDLVYFGSGLQDESAHDGCLLKFSLR